MHNWVTVEAAAVVFALSAALPWLVRPLLIRLQVIDVPNERSSHSRPVIRGAGLAALLSMLAGYLLVFAGGNGDFEPDVLLPIAAVTLSAGLLGLAEDVRGIPVRWRAAGQLAIGLLGSAAIVMSVGGAWQLTIIYGIAVAAYVNVANFMDGVNGISAMHGTAVGSTFAVVGFMLETPWLAVAGLVLAAAFAGFLPWNVRGTMFLGDVGSYLLGGGIVVIAVSAISRGVPILSVIAPMVIYLADTGVTLLTRTLRREKWYSAHRTHYYQRLTDSGYSHIAVALIVTCATVATSSIGLLSLLHSTVATIISLTGIAVVCACYLALPRVGRRLRQKKHSNTRLCQAPSSDLPSKRGEYSARNWAVIGASGFVGRAVVAELLSQGLEVRAISAPRLELSPESTPADVMRQVEAHEDVVKRLAAQLVGTDVIVNAAGVAAPDAKSGPLLFGANAFLPALVAVAAERARAARLLHISSAAVQGRRDVLDETPATQPFSPYSSSKALGEATLLHLADVSATANTPEIVIVRATSVQGAGRPTTIRLAQMAQSRIASVAGSGNRPTIVSSLRGLIEFVIRVGAYTESVPTIVLQPWEGLTTGAVLENAGGRKPRKLSMAFCRCVIAVGYSASVIVPQIAGMVRRVELMWMGQAQDAGWSETVGFDDRSYIVGVLQRACQGES